MRSVIPVRGSAEWIIRKALHIGLYDCAAAAVGVLLPGCRPGFPPGTTLDQAISQGSFLATAFILVGLAIFFLFFPRLWLAGGERQSAVKRLRRNGVE